MELLNDDLNHSAEALEQFVASTDCQAIGSPSAVSVMAGVYLKEIIAE
jgi:hypothetical protein